jgi:phosphoribosylaminoimidazole carboxylase PurE protein
MTKKVAVVMGSDSDLPVMEAAVEMLKEFDVPYTARILSAHRTPAQAGEFAARAERDRYGVIIAGAGGAAHLAGAMAANTTLPVIGVPLSSSPLSGFDALLATVQMPAGVPVACVAVGKAGAKNAALLAIQILALSDGHLKRRLKTFKKRQGLKVQKKDKNLAL